MNNRRTTIQRQTVTAAVTEELREQILTGELAEGEQLRQDAIAARFNVSRIPIREALRQLEAEGLVIFYPHRGAVVSALSIEEIRELFDIRRLLECDLLKHSVPNMTEKEFAKAQEVLDAYGEAIEANDVASFGELNWRFHEALYTTANRPRSMSIAQNVNNNVDRYLRTQLTLKGAQEVAMREHTDLLDLCKQGKVEDAVTLMDEHIRNGGDSLIEFLVETRANSQSKSESR